MFHSSIIVPVCLSHLSTGFWMPDAKNDAGCCSSHCQTTDYTSVSDANFCNSAPPQHFFHRPKMMIITGAQIRAVQRVSRGVVTPLTPRVPQSPESDVQCAVERYHATESLLTDGTNVWMNLDDMLNMKHQCYNIWRRNINVLSYFVFSVVSMIYHLWVTIVNWWRK